MSILKYIRPILQWVVVALAKNLAKIAEGASHLADWLAMVGFFFVIYHVITVLKRKMRFNDFGALDSLISITIAFTEEVIQNPCSKIVLTLVFPLFMATREHRARLKMNKSAPNLATVTWILNNRYANMLPHHHAPFQMTASFLSSCFPHRRLHHTIWLLHLSSVLRWEY